MYLKKMMICVFTALLSAVAPLAEETVIDTKTYLMWQDVPENKEMTPTWEEAKTECGLLSLAGHADWWLPSEDELATIVDNSRPAGRKIKQGFVYYKPGAYWTSSTYAWNAPHAWVIAFVKKAESEQTDGMPRTHG